MSVFPERLRLRDTELFDDLGGAGQRIFTTAGQRYEKQEYVRADVHDAEIQRLQKMLGAYENGWGEPTTINALRADNERIQAQITMMIELYQATADGLKGMASAMEELDIAGKEGNP